MSWIVPQPHEGGKRMGSHVVEEGRGRRCVMEVVFPLFAEITADS